MNTVNLVISQQFLNHSQLLFFAPIFTNGKLWKKLTKFFIKKYKILTQYNI